MNSLNGEWRTGVQIGDETSLFTEIYQPLDPHSRYFTSGKVGYESRNVNVFDAAGNNLARYQLATYGLELGVGREFGTWGEGRFGYRRGSGTAEVTVGTPAPDLDVDLGEVFLRLADDKFDDLYFPRTGHLGRLELRVARDGLGAPVAITIRCCSATRKLSPGATIPSSASSLAQLRSMTTRHSQACSAPVVSCVSPGSRRTSSAVSISGRPISSTCAVLQPLSSLRPISAPASSLGMSGRTPVTYRLDNTIFAGSVFLGLNTPIGPVYLAYGRTEQEDQAIYLYIGPRFSF